MSLTRSASASNSKTLKRVLAVSCNLPYPPENHIHGLFQRLGMFLEAAASLAERVDLLYFARPELADGQVRVRVQEALAAKYATEIDVTIIPAEHGPRNSFYKELLSGTLGIQHQSEYAPYCQPRPLRALGDAVSKGPDLILAHRLSAMIPLLRLRQPLPPIFFDLDDIEHRALFRSLMTSTGWWMTKLLIAHTPALALAEIQAVRRASNTLVCSETDRRYLQRLVGGKGRLAVIPNAVDVPTEENGRKESPVVLFVGVLSHPPNTQAANELTERVWPLIKRKVPGAQLIIAGMNPERILAFRRTGDDVQVLGFVPDLNEIYQRTAVVCCPIRSGSGTRIKIIEACGRGIPVVSTKLGAEGLAYREEREILIRETPEALADACVRLLQDETLRRDIGQAARARTVTLYDRSVIVDRVRSRMAEAACSACCRR
jgi:glycosyltransferase involved in cell wall biosynthesis